MAKRTNTAVWLEKYERWQIKVMKDGERKTFTCPTPGRKGQRECNAKADAWLDDNISCEKKRVETVWDEYVERLKMTTSPANWKQIESFGNKWVKPCKGSKRIQSLTEGDLQEIIDRAASAKLAYKTLLGIKTATNSFVKYCRRNKYTTLLPEGLTIPKSAKRSEKTILQPDDLLTLFTKDLTTKYKKVVPDELICAYRFEVLTGLRPGELLGLEWSDIDGMDVSLKRSINRYHQTTTGKNENAIRKFTLTDSAHQVLMQQRKRNPFGRVFGSITQAQYRDAWKRYRAYNQITPITPYELRHTFVSIAKNLPEGQIRAMVGHSKNMDTFGTYGHEVLGERERTAIALQQIFADLLNGEVG